MARTPTASASPTNTQKLGLIEAEIDDKLGNEEYVSNNYSHVDKSIPFLIKHELTASEKEELCKRYVNAGWVGLTVTNSSDNGERGMCGGGRGGICSITLYYPAKKDNLTR